MKLVTFARDMAPHGAGDTRVVPDEVADRLQREGALSACEAYGAPEAPRAHAVRPTRAQPKPARPAGTPDGRLAL